MIKVPVANGSNFFSSGLRQKVDQLMDILWAGGVNNPMDSIEQISYLLFLRLLTEKDDLLASLDKKYTRIFSGKWSRYAWGNFVTLTGDALFDAVRNAIESLHELPGLSETGKLLFNRATLKIYDRPTLRAVVQGIHGLDLSAHDGHDVKRGHVRVSALKTVGLRHERSVSHASAHHQHDCRIGRSKARTAHL